MDDILSDAWLEAMIAEFEDREDAVHEVVSEKSVPEGVE